MNRLSRKRLAALAALPLLCLGAGAAAQTPQVGVTSSAAGEPVGRPPAQNERILKVGTNVFSSEDIRTGADDRAHLLFNDGTAMTIGPSSQIKIDKYVYDPDKGTGDIGVTVAKGAFRLVGGKITKTSEAVVNTPTGTLGIRGGITVVDAENPQEVKTFFIFGDKMRVWNGLGQQQAFRPGSVVEMYGGQGPGGARLASRIELAAALRPFERTTPGPSNPGAGTPTATNIEQALAQSGVGPNNSLLSPKSITLGDADPGSGKSLSDLSSLSDLVANNVRVSGTPQTTPPPPPPPDCGPHYYKKHHGGGYSSYGNRQGNRNFSGGDLRRGPRGPRGGG
jgi:hypothetical protein